MANPAIITRHLTVGYGMHAVLSNLNLELAAGELTVLIGANGSGKSTLLRTLCGAQSALNGDVIVGGEPIQRLSAAQLARRMALVLTDRRGGGGLTVHELVSIGRNPYSGFFGRLSPDDRRAVAAAIEAVGLSHKTRAHLSDLSDGERQKAMIARAVAQDTPIIVLDEPTAFLDVSARWEIMQLLTSLAARADRSILLSTHDIAPALETATRLWAITQVAAPAGESTVAQGTPATLAARGILNHIYSGVSFSPARNDFYPE